MSAKDIDEIIAEIEAGLYGRAHELWTGQGRDLKEEAAVRVQRGEATVADIIAEETAEPPYNGWKSWATWHAYMTVTGDYGLYVDARAEALRASGADAFAAWALPRYLEALRALGEATPEIYAEPDAIDWHEVWDALREG